MAEGAQILSNLGTISYMHAVDWDSAAEGRKPNVRGVDQTLQDPSS